MDIVRCPHCKSEEQIYTLLYQHEGNKNIGVKEGTIREIEEFERTFRTFISVSMRRIAILSCRVVEATDESKNIDEQIKEKLEAKL